MYAGPNRLNHYVRQLRFSPCSNRRGSKDFDPECNAFRRRTLLFPGPAILQSQCLLAGFGFLVIPMRKRGRLQGEKKGSNRRSPSNRPEAVEERKKSNHPTTSHLQDLRSRSLPDTEILVRSSQSLMVGLDAEHRKNDN